MLTYLEFKTVRFHCSDWLVKHITEPAVFNTVTKPWVAQTTVESTCHAYAPMLVSVCLCMKIIIHFHVMRNHFVLAETHYIQVNEIIVN